MYSRGTEGTSCLLQGPSLIRMRNLDVPSFRKELFVLSKIGPI